MRDATITTTLVITEVCSPGQGCTQTTVESVSLQFTADDMWAALAVAAREAGVEVGVLLSSYVRTGLARSGYELADAA